MAADGMGYMPQNPYAFSFSVLRNVEMALDGEAEREAAAREALRRVGMDALAQASGSKLSGGEAQRMAFARMIAKPRQLLLLDEPTSSTDIKGTDLIEATLLSYLQANACTLIFSTHSPAQALRLAEEVIFWIRGASWSKVRQRACSKPHKTSALSYFLSIGASKSGRNL
jgi:ABC-type nitrate/sulfonate/bicarbonate transport system ATPase subunit